jgi:two-component system phosphate regulon sensor histidine kinase PhoR
LCLERHGFVQAPSFAQIHRVAESGAPVLIERVSDAGMTNTLAYLPLNAAQDSLGALVIETSAQQMAFARPLFEAVAAHLALALKNLRAQERPHRLSTPTEREWDEFLAHAAHEIKNPLASIKGYADLLSRRAAREPSDPYQKGLTIISQQVGRTTGILEQLSDLARIGTDRLRLDRHEVDLAAVARHVADQYQATTDQHQIGYDDGGAPLRASCDAERIGQVIGTMLSNAIKFSPHGGPVTVNVRRTDGDGQRSPRDEAIILVADQGIGVPDGEQDRVFERFFRGSNVAGAYRGLGIGLFIARAIVERHGGRMWLESAPGQGTASFVALPLQ